MLASFRRVSYIIYKLSVRSRMYAHIFQTFVHNVCGLLLAPLCACFLNENEVAEKWKQIGIPNNGIIIRRRRILNETISPAGSLQ